MHSFAHSEFVELAQLFNIVKILNFFIYFSWNYSLQNSPKRLDLKIDLYDEVGIGGGASGIAGGLLHPYSPKGFCYILHPNLGIMDCFPFICLPCCLHF